MRKNELRHLLRERLHDMERLAQPLFWLEEISVIWECGEPPSIGEVGPGDQIIANAYAAMLQVLYLYAEKEGAIPAFSAGLSDDRPVSGVTEYDINAPRRIEYEFALVMAEKYGWTFPREFNVSRRSQEYTAHTCDVTELDERLIRKLAFSGCASTRERKKREKEYEKAKLSDFRCFIESNMDSDAIACMLNPEWMRLQARYFSLPDEARKELPYNEVRSAILTATGGGEDDFTVEGDSLMLDDGYGVVDFCHIRYYCTSEYGYGGDEVSTPLIGAFCSSRLAEHMEAADRALKNFRRKLAAVERGLKKGVNKNG